MKRNSKKFLCLILTLGMVCNVSSPLVVQAAKKKAPVLNKKKLTLTVGQTAKLKVKNIKKKIKWSSSKKSVATVTKKGKVKAKKVGKTTITAKIGKKKLKCKVTVKAVSVTETPSFTVEPSKEPDIAVTPTPEVVVSPTPEVVVSPTPEGTVPPANTDEEVVPTQQPEVESEIASLTYVSSEELVVTLKSSKELEKTNFDVKTKIYKNGSYNRPISVKEITTEDNITYHIFINEEIQIGHYVQVTVAESNGIVSAIEGIFNKKNDQVIQTRCAYEKGEEVSRKIYIEGVGYSSLISVDLPEGLNYIKLEESTGEEYILITGKLKKPGIVEKEIVWKDELGNTYTNKIEWVVSSEETIVAYCNPSYVTLSAGSKTIQNPFYVNGGSGSYLYNVANENVTISASGSNRNLTRVFAEEGVYEMEVEVVDANNEEIKTTFTWVVNVVQSRRVTVRLLDMDGKPINYEERSVKGEAQNTESPYEKKYAYTLGNTSNTNLYLYLVDGMWDIVAKVAGHECEYKNLEVNGKDITLDIQTPLYKIKLPETDVDLSKVYWYNDSAIKGIGTEFYAPIGNLTYRATIQNKLDIIVYEVNCNVSTEVKENVATLSVVNETECVSGFIDLTTSPILTLDLVCEFYAFVPEETGTYTFYTESVSTGVLFTYGILYDSDLNELDSDDAGNGLHYAITYECIAGETYYIGTKINSSSYKGKQVCLKVKKEEAE